MMTFNAATLARVALLLSSFATISYGHLIMNSPVPFGVDTLNNSPMVDAKPGSAGSDFPCKQRPGVYDITAMNNMAVGDSQLLNFTGSASHGGGTCQIAVTMDLEPTIHSVWKLIQVFEGGCPISADGNDGTHPFTFTIPKGFPNGRATLSWTWYNRIGNREIYQNCAPITVTGGASDKTLYDSLPEWYIINLPTSECTTVETTDVIIPNPGQYIMKNTAEDNTLAAASGASCAASAAAQTSGVTGYKTAVIDDGAAYSAPAKNGDVTGPAKGGASATGAASGSGAAPGTTAPAMVSNQVSNQAPGATSASGIAPASTQATGTSAPSMPAAPSGSGSAPATPSSPSAPPGGISGPATGSASAPPPANSGSASGGGSTGSSTGSSTGTCTGSGTVVCNGPNQFGLCNNGNVVWQAVAAGTTCSNGQITKRTVLRDTRLRRRMQVENRDVRELVAASSTNDF